MVTRSKPPFVIQYGEPENSRAAKRHRKSFSGDRDALNPRVTMKVRVRSLFSRAEVGQAGSRVGIN